jgi:c-di-GMP-binding flagellar brake protein YcgR
MKIELISAEESDRYLVRQPREIERILHGVKDSKAMVAIYADNGEDFILSSILEIDRQNTCIILEQGADRAMNDAIRKSAHVTFATLHDQVHVQFSAKSVEADTFGDLAAFRVPIPRELLRLQRREYYRLATSVMNPVRCLINTGQGLVETVVLDISIGGVGVLAYQTDGSLRAGETYHGCRITLPGSGEFALSLSVCTTFDVTLRNGKHSHRAGCQFIDLPPSVETEIQRYIIREERERRARYI